MDRNGGRISCRVVPRVWRITDDLMMTLKFDIVTMVDVQ